MTIQEAYLKMQAAWVAEHDVKVGDTVRVLRAAKSQELGWAWKGNWRPQKTKMVGNRFNYVGVGDHGIELKKTDGVLWYFPFFVLEKVASAPKEPTDQELWDRFKLGLSPCYSAFIERIALKSGLKIKSG